MGSFAPCGAAFVDGSLNRGSLANENRSGCSALRTRAAERIVSYLTEELVRQGHEVTLFASGDSKTSSMLRSYLVFGDIEGKHDVLRVECTKCDRKRRYQVHKLTTAASRGRLSSDYRKG
jgi:hypothetical protein